jgi:hypothetical protein
MNSQNKTHTSVRLTGTALTILHLQSWAQGISQAAVIEIALREYDKAHPQKKRKLKVEEFTV